MERKFVKNKYFEGWIPVNQSTTRIHQDELPSSAFLERSTTEISGFDESLSNQFRVNIEAPIGKGGRNWPYLDEGSNPNRISSFLEDEVSRNSDLF